MRANVLADGTLSEGELNDIDTQAEQMMDDAIQFAEAGELPDMSELYADVYVDYPLDQLSRGAGMLI